MFVFTCSSVSIFFCNASNRAGAKDKVHVEIYVHISFEVTERGIERDSPLVKCNHGAFVKDIVFFAKELPNDEACCCVRRMRDTLGQWRPKQQCA